MSETETSLLGSLAKMMRSKLMCAPGLWKDALRILWLSDFLPLDFPQTESGLRYRPFDNSTMGEGSAGSIRNVPAKHTQYEGFHHIGSEDAYLR